MLHFDQRKIDRALGRSIKTRLTRIDRFSLVILLIWVIASMGLDVLS